MKPVTIAVSVKHAGFAADLAKGLMELGRPYFVEIAGAEGETAPESQWEVLVTDFGEKEGLAACFEPYRVIHVQEDTCRISRIAGRISAAARKLRSQAEEEYPEPSAGTGHGELESGSGRIVLFQSFWGGAGVTSLAVASGRMLSGAYGERVLYLPLTARDGSRMYRRGCEGSRMTEGSGPEGTAAELYYRMKNGRPFCLDDYVCSDDAGLEYLSWGVSGGSADGMSGEELTAFLKLLGKMTDYGWILADGGTGDFSGPADLRVLVDSRQDCRCRPGDSCTGELRLLVHNRGMENRLEPSGGMMPGTSVLELMEDGESFLTDEEGTVEIILSKTYGAGIKIFSEWLLETVANPVESWR